MENLAIRRTAVELSMTKKLKRMTRGLKDVVHPIKLLVDAGIHVTLCSFRVNANPYTRSETLHYVATTARFNISEVVRVLSYGFTNSFQPLHVRRALLEKFVDETELILADRGFKQFRYLAWLATDAAE